MKRVFVSRLFRHGLAVLLVAMALVPSVQAQQDDKRAREALRRLQQQQREFNDQKARLEAEKAKLEKDLADKDKQGKQQQSRIKKAEAAARQAEADLKLKDAQLEELRKELEATNLKYVEARERGDKLADNLKASQDTVKARDAQNEIDNTRINLQRDILARQAQMIQTCDEKNLALYKVGMELLGRYRDKGVVDALKQAEPFTQIERVRMENLWQEYRDKLDAAKVERPVIAQ